MVGARGGQLRFERVQLSLRLGVGLQRFFQPAQRRGVANGDQQRLDLIRMVAQRNRLQLHRPDPRCAARQFALDRAGAGRPDTIREFPPGVDLVGREVLLEPLVENLAEVVFAEKTQPRVVAGQQQTVAADAKQTGGLLFQQRSEVGGLRRVRVGRRTHRM